MTKEEQLFSAIGSIDEHFLEELEAPQLHRLPRRFALVAAIFVLLLTACAAPAVIRAFNKLETGEISGNGRGHTIHFYTMTSGKRVWEEAEFFIPSDVELDVAVDPDAPDTVETRYFPTALLDYCQIQDYVDTPSEFSLTLSMKAPGGKQAQGIFFRQYPLPADGHIVVPDVFDRDLGLDLYLEELHDTMQTYGDITVLEFSGDFRCRDTSGELLTHGNRLARHHTKFLFWSDGFYLYCLKLPLIYPLNVEKIEGILSSLTAIEDIREYLS